MDILKVPSPAKINLFLHILARLPNRMHRLQSVFQLVDLSDTLTFTPRQDAAIHVTGNVNCTMEENLIYKAAQCLKATTTTTTSLTGFDIHVEKNIPIGAGLGGGSSNAATTLLTLHALWKTHHRISDFLHLGKTLGADIPFFIAGHGSSWVEGIGDELSPYPLPKRWYVLLYPRCHVSTGEVFQNAKWPQTPPLQKNTYRLGDGSNHLTMTTCTLYPPVQDAFTWLQEHAPNAQMTGTGSTVFAHFEHYEDAKKIHQNTPTNVDSFLCQSLECSPLVNILPLST